VGQTSIDNWAKRASQRTSQTSQKVCQLVKEWPIRLHSSMETKRKLIFTELLL